MILVVYTRPFTISHFKVDSYTELSALLLWSCLFQRPPCILLYLPVLFSHLQCTSRFILLNLGNYPNLGKAVVYQSRLLHMQSHSFVERGISLTKARLNTRLMASSNSPLHCITEESICIYYQLSSQSSFSLDLDFVGASAPSTPDGAVVSLDKEEAAGVGPFRIAAVPITPDRDPLR